MRRLLLTSLLVLPQLAACVAGSADGLPVGTDAPAITATEWANTTAPVDLAALRGKPVLLEFWSKDCSPCVGRIPEMQALHSEFGDRVEVLTVHVAYDRLAPRQDSAAVRAFLDRWDIKYPVAIPQTEDVLRSYAFNYLPHAVMLDSEGRVVWSANPGSGDLRAIVEEHLAAAR